MMKKSTLDTKCEILVGLLLLLEFAVQTEISSTGIYLTYTGYTFFASLHEISDMAQKNSLLVSDICLTEMTIQ